MFAVLLKGQPSKKMTKGSNLEEATWRFLRNKSQRPELEEPSGCLGSPGRTPQLVDHVPIMLVGHPHASFLRARYELILG